MTIDGVRVERVVIDTSVLISAALSGTGKPFRCLLWVRAHARLVTSAETAEEFRSRLQRPKFRKYLSTEEASDFVAALVKIELRVAPVRRIRVCRDPADDMVLEAALAGEAQVIVTGDRDLLVLDPFESVRLMTPAAFLEAVGAN